MEYPAAHTEAGSLAAGPGPINAIKQTTVERLFSVVGMNYSDKRKSGHADTLEDLAFTRLNL